MAEVIPKEWGEEHWIVNRNYAGKKMVLFPGRQCSLHVHKIKDETFYVTKGTVLMEIDGERRIMSPGDDQLILQGQLHRFTGIGHGNAEIIEFSTHHYDTEDTDNFRVEKSRVLQRETAYRPDIYVTGNRGYLGRAMDAVFLQHGLKTFGSDVEFLDLTDRVKVLEELHTVKPQAIVHTAAMSDWAACEKNPQQTHKMNIEATRTLAEYCKETGIPFIHVSTDFIFAGNTGNYNEQSPVGPINVYGRTKAVAEDMILDTLEDALILRAGTFYGTSYVIDRPVFVHKVIRKLSSGESYAVAVDEISNPTMIQDLGKVTAELLKRNKTGVWNVGGADMINRYELAIKTAETFGLDAGLIKKSTMAELGTFEKRPRNVSLSMGKLNREGIYTTGVADGLQRMKRMYDEVQPKL
ncbi:MAG: sugar nucleotide-binding protein [Phycisphaerae bacterium]